MASFSDPFTDATGGTLNASRTGWRTASGAFASGIDAKTGTGAALNTLDQGATSGAAVWCWQLVSAASGPTTGSHSAEATWQSSVSGAPFMLVVRANATALTAYGVNYSGTALRLYSLSGTTATLASGGTSSLSLTLSVGDLVHAESVESGGSFTVTVYVNGVAKLSGTGTGAWTGDGSNSPVGFIARSITHAFVDNFAAADLASAGSMASTASLAFGSTGSLTGTMASMVGMSSTASMTFGSTAAVSWYPSPTVTEGGAFIAVRAFLLSILSPGTEVIQSQVNRVAEPKSKNFVVMTSAAIKQLSTSRDAWDYALSSPSYLSVSKSLQLDIQLDIHGPQSADNATLVALLFRDGYASYYLASYGVQPLYSSDPRQAPFVNGAGQYENRWTMMLSLQGNPVVSTPQQFAGIASVTIVGA